jgi:restriction endonuclease S subunit
MDAEYYQPFFLKLIKHWREQSIGPLGNNYARIMKRRFLPECGKRFDYIEISRVSTILGTYDVVHLDDTEAPSRAQYFVKPGDVILSEVRPNRSAVSLIPGGIGRTVCSSGFGVLKAERISPEYLFAYFKTSIITKLLDRETTATIRMSYPCHSLNPEKMLQKR